MRFEGILALSLFGLAIVACEKEKPGPMVPAAGTTQAIDKGIMDLANARCDRQQRCNNIGPNAKYSSRDHCMSVQGGEARDKLQGCTHGVDQDDMRQCLTAIQNQDCSGLFSDVGEDKACGMDDLCAD
ncbi:MAG TPA: DUF6184 family natural product biosynthesis lipoprotein [Polyangiaceae bacterium]|nr:DUF6184 family natural product biosynthesis lipoprotein [Polyangiaceae bacterium]